MGKESHSAQHSAHNGMYVKLYVIPKNRNTIAIEAFAPVMFLLPFLPTVGINHEPVINDVFAMENRF